MNTKALSTFTTESDVKDYVLSHPIGYAQAREYIDRGHSALVFGASLNGAEVALKVFDPMFMERKGISDADQLERLRRQAETRSFPHPNLVRIIETGRCSASGLYFVAMERIQGDTLAQAVSTLPRDRLREVFHQIVLAAKHLMDSGFVHRDIKPSNVGMQTDPARAVLLDLGVVKPLDLAGIWSDITAGQFLGTHRYSPPEFLSGPIEDRTDSWTAVTYYQLGAVLHDMIMRRPLFHDIETEEHVIAAVLQRRPTIDAADVDYSLIHLARSCLDKDPVRRLSRVSWKRLLSDESELPSENVLRDSLRSLTAVQSSISTPAYAPERLRHGLVKALKKFRRLSDSVLPAATIRSPVNAPREIRVEFADDAGRNLRAPTVLTIELDLPVQINADSEFTIRASAYLGAQAPAGLRVQTFTSHVPTVADVEDVLRRLMLHSIALSVLASAERDGSSRGDPLWLQLGHAPVEVTNER